MNKTKLKSYAPAARRDFIQAVTDRAHFFGLSEKEITPVEESGDVAIIGGRPFPRSVAAQRKKLEERIKREGFNQVMEAIAYTWFNRFLALRYMELHGYLEHGFRVLSNTGSSTVPEILDHAAHLDLPGLNKQQVVELKLDGSKDAELYRLLLVAQCNALHAAMPFLFEKIEDETELLLPDNLLHSDSLIRKLVSDIDEDDWQEVEIIGWLYQFYISEKKDQVMGKVVRSEDIPAATQLFTPNWIVKYMVQNSLGRKWFATYPGSSLKSKMEYYIDPAEQTAEVNAQLAVTIPSSLNPEDLTLLDPACGSGHILVEAYDVFKEIYLERGYSNRDFPRVILEKNLYGLDIDDRAAQMAGFALLMRARNDDRRILRSDKPVRLNLMSIQESGDVSFKELPLYQGEGTGELSLENVAALVDLFKSGKTFGSLIYVPPALAAELPAIEEALQHILTGGDLYASQAAQELLPLVKQGAALAKKYDCVVANPPYMGGGGMNPALKAYSRTNYPNSMNDLYSMFIEKCLHLTNTTGISSLVTMQGWMFLSSFEDFRNNLLSSNTLYSMAHLGPRAFSEISGEVVQTTTFTIGREAICDFVPIFYRLIDGNEEHKANNLKSQTCRIANLKQSDFSRIPSTILAYWVSNNVIDLFLNNPSLGDLFKPRAGTTTTDNGRFLRYWHEVSVENTFYGCSDLLAAKESGIKWFPYNKGGGFRKYYGNNDYLMNWQHDGEELKYWITHHPVDPSSWSRYIRSVDFYFQPGITWGDVGTGIPTFRWQPKGYIAGSRGPTIFSENILLLSYLNSKVSHTFLQMMNPTLTFNVGEIAKLPIIENLFINKNLDITEKTDCLLKIYTNDWDSYENSVDFACDKLIDIKSSSLAVAFKTWQNNANAIFDEAKELDEKINKYWIEKYGLTEEISPNVQDKEIKLQLAEREVNMKHLISYAIGCMMGRYSLDQQGLVYANSGNNGFDQSKYHTFPADDDGIVPVMDMDWFPDDAASRFEEFLKVAWSPEMLEENLKFVADSLSPKGGESPRETIRRYISTQFFKDHLQTYKKRPIYWLFSSGKQRAFECLVYLHRYNDATLSRMRNEYVTPLQGKFSAQVDYLSNEVNAASSTAERNRLQKQLDALRKKQVELATFDDLLRHYADQRISLDLDDGVKVNYGKFGNLLAEVKAVTGGSE